MKTLNAYQAYFLKEYSNYPQGRYITLFLLREVESEAIFRTEGSGEPLNREFVYPGLRSDDEPIQRVVISKRKQTAVERRTGRELLRRYELLFEKDKKSGVCALNRNNPCGKCMDCMIYGYAVGGGGAQKSRVITDDAFSLHPAATIVGIKQFNALFDNGTMRDPETGKPSTSIGADEYVKPETIFLDMETLKDMTQGEFLYVLGNILRSTRYGAISSRIGKIRNHLVGVAFSDCELFSNLEWTQATYDQLRGDAEEPEFPLHIDQVRQAAQQAAQQLMPNVIGQVKTMPQDEIAQLVKDLKALYEKEEDLKRLLTETSKMYPKG